MMAADPDESGAPRHSLDYAPRASERERRPTRTFWVVMLIALGVGVLLVDICSDVTRNRRAPATTSPSVARPARAR
jgi:hypothetical protein